MHKRLILAGVVLFTIGVGLAGYFLVVRDNKITTKYCSSPEFATRLNNQAIFYTENADELKALASEIKLIENYESNANCMYVVVRESMITETLDKVEEKITKLKTVFDQTGYSTPIIELAKTPEQLLVDISIIKEVQSKNTLEAGIIDNSFSGSVPPQ